MVGMLCSSKAGHDINEVYVIVREDQEYIYVADGRNKTIASPKKKNKKHVQLIKKAMDLDLARRLVENSNVKEEEIKRVITLYKNGD